MNQWLVVLSIASNSAPPLMEGTATMNILAQRGTEK